jgi:cob(I)alamin adenosyltransferase
MSIATKTGDDGTTALMFGRRVPKNHPRVEAYGAVDELNAALGLARATTVEDFISDNLLAIQKDLIVLMGELCVLPEDLPRYTEKGFHLVARALTMRLDALVKEIESQDVASKGWAMPGGTNHAAALDLARTICRRAERRVCDLQATGASVNGEILIYLNRLSDVLWLLARWTEATEVRPPNSSQK